VKYVAQLSSLRSRLRRHDQQFSQAQADLATASANAQLAAVTAQRWHAVPTVQLAKLDQGSGEQVLTLPGNIQPFNKADLYARVSGYLGSWRHDIGAHGGGNDMRVQRDNASIVGRMLSVGSAWSGR
jgi:hypothetical protein